MPLEDELLVVRIYEQVSAEQNVYVLMTQSNKKTPPHLAKEPTLGTLLTGK